MLALMYMYTSKTFLHIVFGIAFSSKPTKHVLYTMFYACSILRGTVPYHRTRGFKFFVPNMPCFLDATQVLIRAQMYLVTNSFFF